jgi:hypothetical protein
MVMIFKKDDLHKKQDLCEIHVCCSEVYLLALGNMQNLYAVWKEISRSVWLGYRR